MSYRVRGVTEPRGSSGSRWTRRSTRRRVIAVVAVVAVAVVGFIVHIAAPSIGPVSAGGRVWYVNADGSSSGAGTLTSPLSTIAAAVGRAASGDRVQIGPGRFHEQVQVYGKSIVVRGAGADRTVLDGTRVVTSWTRDGARWYAPWSSNFGRADDIQTTPSRREAGYPEQFFVDGVALREVATLDKVVSGSFFNDVDAGRVWVADDLRTRLVEGSDLEWGLYLNRAHGSTVADLTVQRYATAQSAMAAVRLYADDLTASGLVVRSNAYAGLSAMGQRIVIQDVVAADNGQIGMHGHTTDGLTIRGATITGNNTEMFDPSWAAGGVKVTTSNAFTITDSVVDHNRGPAIWVDLQVTRTVIARNAVRNNLRSGLMLELSSDIIAADNLITGNGQAGIYVLESQRVRLWHNAAFDNHWDLRILTGPRDDVYDIDVFNNAFGGSVPSGQAIVHVDDWTCQMCAEEMNVAWDHNRYWWPKTSNAQWVSRIQHWPAPQSLSTTIEQHRAATSGGDLNAQLSRATTNPYARDVAAGDGRAPVGAVVGAPLPADVAAVVGLADGYGHAPGAVTVRSGSTVVTPPTPIYSPRDVQVNQTPIRLQLSWKVPAGGQLAIAYAVWVNGDEVRVVTETGTEVPPADAGDSYVQVQSISPTGVRSVKTAPVRVPALDPSVGTAVTAIVTPAPTDGLEPATRLSAPKRARSA